MMASTTSSGDKFAQRVTDVTTGGGGGGGGGFDILTAALGLALWAGCVGKCVCLTWDSCNQMPGKNVL